MIPEYWKTFVNQHSLDGREIDIPEESDLSELGANFEIFDEISIRYETENLYPGIVVAKEGFVPVGGCLLGSGDQYYINRNDGSNGPLYRIYHDMFGGESYEKDKAIVVVLRNYAEVLKFIVIK
ncbi:MAG: hypothetical protein WCI27_10000 [Candidatus Omnitrophota bacterium]